jgi:hypothetical protein
MRYRSTGPQMYDLRKFLLGKVAEEVLNKAIRVQDMVIRDLDCLDHGPLHAWKVMCSATDPPHAAQRVAVDHAVLDIIARDGSDEVRAAIAGARVMVPD